MSVQVGSAAWLASVARLIAAESVEELSSALEQLVDTVAPNSNFALMAFREDRPPVVVAHDLGEEDEQHYLKSYIAGPYLLDPLYELALKPGKPGSCRFREVTPDRFRSSEYYRQYCERFHLGDEVDFFVDTEDGRTLVLVVARIDARYTPAQAARLRDCEPVFHAAMHKLWQLRDAADGDDIALRMHERLTECFDNFGATILTQREREITQLLLRGHSTKSIARVLDIAPGTVMVHKRNLFAKLGITSQYELFSRFIEQLSAA